MDIALPSSDVMTAGAKPMSCRNVNAPPRLKLNAPPSLKLLPWAKVKRFEYCCDDGRVATIELTAELRGAARAPVAAEIRLRRGVHVTSHRPIVTTLQRTGGSTRQHRHAGLLWSAVFKVPLRLVEHPDNVFELATARRDILTLPTPVLHEPAPSVLTTWLSEKVASGHPLLAPSRRVSVLASSVAFGAGLSSAAVIASPATAREVHRITNTVTTAVLSVLQTTSTKTTAPPAHKRVARSAGAAATTSTSTASPTSTSAAATSSTGTLGTTSTGTLGTTSTGTTTAPVPSTATSPPATPATPTGTQQSTAPTDTGTTTTPATTTNTPAPTTSTPAPTTSTPTSTDPAASTTPAPAGAGTTSGQGTTPTTTTRTHSSTTGTTPARTAPLGAVLTSATKTSPVLALSGTVTVKKASHKPTHAPHKPATHASHKPKVLSGNAAVNAGDNDGGTAIANAPPQSTTTTGSSSPWSGSAWINPFNAAELQFYASLVKNINLPPKYLVPIYKAAARRYHLPWQLLAAINRVETDYGADLSVSTAGAVGWMQFMPSTWSQWGMAVNRRNKRVRGIGNPYNPRDAIFAAARYLDASGGSHDVPRAVFAYNHADWYVVQVLSIAQQINVHGLHRRSRPNHKIAVMLATAHLLNGMPYVWGGGHSNWTISLGYDCSGFVSTVLHSAGLLQAPQTTQTLPSQPWMRPGKGRWVTIYDRTDGGSLMGDHVIIDIKGQWWESGGSSVAGGAERVHRIRMTRAFKRAYLPTFNVVMHPYGL